MELGSVTEGQPGSARHFQTPGFPPTGPVVGVPGRVRHRRPAGSLVPCTGGTGTAILWFPTRAVRARPFSGSQHRLCGHGRSLVPSTGCAGTIVLWFPTRAKHGMEEERCASASERRGGGGQRREEKRDLDWS